MENNNFAILSLVGIVAVVGLLVLFLSGFTHGATVMAEQQQYANSMAGEGYLSMKTTTAAFKPAVIEESPSLYVSDSVISFADQNAAQEGFYDALDTLYPNLIDESSVTILLSTIDNKALDQLNSLSRSNAVLEGNLYFMSLDNGVVSYVPASNNKIGGLIAIGIGLVIVAIGFGWCCKRGKKCCKAEK